MSERAFYSYVKVDNVDELVRQLNAIAASSGGKVRVVNIFRVEETNPYDFSARIRYIAVVEQTVPASGG